MKKLFMFGDGELWLDERVIVLTKDGYDPVICDYSECGCYIAHKHALAGFTASSTTLREALRRFNDHSIEAWNNGIARHLRRLGVKTTRELLERLEH